VTQKFLRLVEVWSDDLRTTCVTRALALQVKDVTVEVC